MRVILASSVVCCYCAILFARTSADRQLPKEDLYYELARQAREGSAGQPVSAADTSEQFKAIIYDGFQKQGYLLHEVKVGLQQFRSYLIAVVTS